MLTDKEKIWKHRQDAKVEAKKSPLKSPASIIAERRARKALEGVLGPTPVLTPSTSSSAVKDMLYCVTRGNAHFTFHSAKELAHWAIEEIGNEDSKRI